MIPFLTEMLEFCVALAMLAGAVPLFKKNLGNREYPYTSSRFFGLVSVGWGKPATQPTAGKLRGEA